MNVPALKQMSAIQMLYVTTLKDPTHVAVKMDIRVMAKAVLVIFFYVHFLIMCFTHLSILEKCFFRLNACNLWLSWGKGHSKPFLALFTDVNECVKPETNECDSNAVCNNTEGSYTCRCLIGYQGDGKNCTGKYLSFKASSSLYFIISSTLIWLTRKVKVVVGM